MTPNFLTYNLCFDTIYFSEWGESWILNPHPISLGRTLVIWDVI